MIKNIIFDLGNVLLDFNPKQYLRNKIKDEQKVQALYEEIFLSEEWPMLDRGTITEKEAINNICKRNNGNSELIRSSMENWYDMLTPIEKNVALLKELKKEGYNIYYLSNYHMLAFENVTKRHDFFKLFDGGVVSYVEKLLKPEEEIYNKLIEKYNLKPSECIFIDDTLKNVEKAKSMGFEIIHFKDTSDLKALLIHQD